MAFDFTGKKILVTGAGQGIGRALAVSLAKCGCHVYAVSRTESKLVSLKEEHPSIQIIVLDIADVNDLETKLECLDAVDGVVNNAAVTHFPKGLPALSITKDKFDPLMDVNVWAAIRITQIFAKKMIDAKKKGSIVNVSSIHGTQAREGAMVYGVTKAALDMVSKGFALELGPHDIRVNSINPTLVLTDVIRQAMAEGSEDFDGFLNRTPRGRVAEVEEVVHSIMYLLSEYSSAVTGSSMAVDCGLLSTFAVNRN